MRRKEPGGFGERPGREQASPINATMVPRYFIVIRGNTLGGMTEEALHFTYFFLSRALSQHREEGKNGEYEAFAVGVLALLQKYRYLYTTVPEPPEPDA